MKALDGARATAVEARASLRVAEERLRNSKAALDAAITSRDVALQEFPDGVSQAHADAQSALDAASAERRRMELELKTLGARTADERGAAEAVLAGAQQRADEARKAAVSAQELLTRARCNGLTARSNRLAAASRASGSETSGSR